MSDLLQSTDNSGHVSELTALAEDGAREAFDDLVEQWRSGLVKLAGGSSLADIGLLGDAMVDLTSAHPSGVAQLFAGRPTRLSNLFREGASLPAARRRARAVVVSVAEHSQRYGVAPTYLAIGVAAWVPSTGAHTDHDDVASLARATSRASDDPDQFAAPESTTMVQAPVLLRPITITPHDASETDYVLTLEPAAEINPLLARTLRANGALLDPVTLARSTFTGSGFDPTAALARIEDLGQAVLDSFQLDSRVLVGAFIHPGQILVEDLDALREGLPEHDVIAALAGVASPPVPTLPEPRQGDADPALERGVGDLDPAQRYVIDVLASGSHVMVDAPAGADVAGTIAAVVAEAAASGRSVLYVPGHRRAADALIHRLETLGLDGLVLDVIPDPTWRQLVSHRLLAAMAVDAEVVDDDAIARNRDALLGARAQLSGYIEALHLQRDPWGISAYDALQELARLTSCRPAPATQVRLDREITLATAGDNRSHRASQLIRAAQLGAFSPQAGASPWCEANLTSDDAAHDAMVRIDRLLTRTLPFVRGDVEEVAQTTGLISAQTARQWGQQLSMLSGMRGTLDVFQPKIFESSVLAMVEATGTKKWRAEHGVELGRLARRRLHRQAREMLRPGVRVTGLHEALVQVHEQRNIWAAECPRGGWPVLPEGLARIEDSFEAARIDLEALDPILSQPGHSLLDVSFDELKNLLNRLSGARADLIDLPERQALLADLRAGGLGDVVDDFADREVSGELVTAEFDLAWWSSVFEHILVAEPMLSSQDSAGLEALARRFRALDKAHIDSLSTPVRIAAREQLAQAMRDAPSAADDLFTELIEGRLTSLRDIAERFGEIHRRLRPVMIATPTLVPHVVPPGREIDLVVLDAVEHAPMELVVSAIARGRQLLVAGDRAVSSQNTIALLAPILPVVALAPEPSQRDTAITEFLADHAYGEVLRPAPMPRGYRLVQYDQVDGVGMPDPRTGAVESSQAEVDRVVDLAIDQAVSRPEESFAIITVSSVHADRVRDALQVEVRRNPALSSIFSGSRREPVVVADVTGTAGLTRDAVIFSVGYGRTPHGRVLHRFGALNGVGGDALLLDAISATRRRLAVVTAFGADDLDPERLRGKGAQLLAEVLRLAEARHGQANALALGNGIDVGGHPDRLLLDLAERLWKAGLTVETSFGVGHGDRIPLAVGHPDLPGEMLVAVLTDDAAYVAERSIRVRDRQVAERLERMGWTVTQVWSAAVFLDPAKEAARVHRIVKDVHAARKAQQDSIEPPPRVVPRVDEVS